MDSNPDTIEGTPKVGKPVDQPKLTASEKALTISLLICAAFLIVSGYLVLSLKDVDRAEKRKELLNKENEELVASIESASREEAEKLEQLKIKTNELVGIEERFIGIKEQYEKAQDMIGERNQALQEYIDLTERITAANKTIDELIDERNELIAVNQDLVRKRTEEQRELLELTEKKNPLSNTVRDLEEKKRSLAKLTEEEEKLNAKIAGLVEKEKQLNLQAAAEEERINKIQDQAQRSSINLSTLEADNRLRTREIGELEKEIASLTVEYDSLQEKIAEGRKEIAEIEYSRKEYFDLKDLNSRLAQEIANKRGQNSSLEGMILEKQNDLSELRSNIKVISEQDRAVALNEAKLGMLDDQIVSKESTLKNLEGQISEAQNNYSDMEADIRSKFNEKENAEEKITLLTAEYDSLQEKIAEGRKEIAEIEYSRKEYSDLKDLNVRLAQEIAGKRGELSSFNGRVLEKQTELSELRSNIEGISNRERVLALKETKFEALNDEILIKEERLKNLDRQISDAKKTLANVEIRLGISGNLN